jgi:hypothetical protein
LVAVPALNLIIPPVPLRPHVRKNMSSRAKQVGAQLEEISPARREDHENMTFI